MLVTAKEQIYNRFTLTPEGDEPLPGAVHFPNNPDIFDLTEAQQLTAEEQVEKWVDGRKKILWDSKKRRNEALDCFVYALAALRISISRWRIEQCSELSAVSASFVLSTPTETDGAVFPGRIMLANTCTWTYRGDECGYHGPAVADEYDQPTSDITKDKCSKCLSGCKFRNNVGNFGGFLSINKLSQ